MILDVKYPTVSQFEWGESAYECGFFTVALLKSFGKDSPALNAEGVDQLADRLYALIDGPNTRTNTSGMSLEAWYNCLKEEAISYEGIGTSESAVGEALNSRHVVAVTVPETSVYDVDLRDSVPYSWTPSGSHIITIIGAEPGVWLCLDTANIGPAGVRSWPRRYDANKLQINLATAINYPWLVETPAPAPPVKPPEPPAPPAPPKITYTVHPGDYLGEIAQHHGIYPVSRLYLANEALIEQTAREHGFASSESGRWIFPGEVLTIP